jgi:DNA-binding NarL/FixJ family response regulator
MKLLVIDDHPIVLEGLAALLQQIGADATVLTAHDAKRGLALLEEHPDLDIVLLDLVLPGLSGHLALTEFGRRRPALPIIVLSSSEDPSDVRKALAIGALGYVPKSASQRTLLSAIRLVLEGELYVPPLMVDKPESDDDDPVARSHAGAAVRLTERQIEVLSMLSEGQPNKKIATRLNLSEKTVKAHISAIFKALNVVNRTQAAAVGRQAGLI